LGQLAAIVDGGAPTPEGGGRQKSDHFDRLTMKIENVDQL
jgi:hypothetical protein